MGYSYPLVDRGETFIRQKLEQIIIKRQCTLPHKTPKDDLVNDNFLEALHNIFDYMQKDSAKGIKYAQGGILVEKQSEIF